jgi:20S proteasome subunit alpha 5
MYLTRSEYDRGVNTFSPEGRLFQVEYAIEAIKLGSTAVGLQTKQGCVLAVEKRLTSPLLDPASVEKIAEIDTHIGAAMSGLVADARTLVDHARVEAQNHTFTYDEPIGVESLTQGTNISCSEIHASQRSHYFASLLILLDFLQYIIMNAAVCDLALSFGEGQDGDSSKRMSRPFGVALLLAGYDELEGPQLFFSDPSGTFVRYKAKAIGAGSEGAQSNLSESYSEDMTLEEAEELALGTLKQVMEEKISTENVELARVTLGKGFHIATAEEVGVVLGRL